MRGARRSRQLASRHFGKIKRNDDVRPYHTVDVLVTDPRSKELLEYIYNFFAKFNVTIIIS